MERHEAREWTHDDASGSVRAPSADDDKYRRGVLGVVTGSNEYPGAAVLSVEAAHRTGVGMVRYVGPRAPRALVLARRPETVPGRGRVQAWLIGSGIAADRRTFLLLGELTHALSSELPVVLDAGALDLVGQRTGPTVITPHAGELQRLFAARETTGPTEHPAEDPAAWATAAAHELGVAVLLKGAVTHVADPSGNAYTVTAPTHWLASAGTGDVLGGILGALAATHAAEILDDPTVLTKLAATAAYLHGQAAVAASRAVGGGPIVALDIAAALPAAAGGLLAPTD
ncbi:ADP-dependent NAD(P)H-hydrate dehydratase [Agromyces seonyuensis]|uniref:ADP-dependent (S)-NAD(P)H-hydrate dehydratase n=1 Tax=Agromyces seonyuensis TaxID=2662446 RepID=A0A6I4NX69_9MICO|nr:ADP/ATP-dependent (S)-NAD(P)H-hydrate dehydratase [Agromyces seonyuensis]MWB98838.1 NAD(P)H-hydrate dehydratase [Agromyces seonyuensis]